jgi:hypothetical protein
VDRDAHVRAARRRQAEDALAFERDREAVLVAELEDLLAEVEGARLDEQLFAALGDGDAALVRVALGHEPPPGTVRAPASEPEPDGWEPEDWEWEQQPDADEADAAEDGDDPEEEIARLQGEIAGSHRIQAALGRYLELLALPARPG